MTYNNAQPYFGDIYQVQHPQPLTSLPSQPQQFPPTPNYHQGQQQPHQNPDTSYGSTQSNHASPPQQNGYYPNYYPQQPLYGTQVLTHCTKYYRQSACGHRTVVQFKYCNRQNPYHDNNAVENENCYNSNRTNQGATVFRAGREYCNDSCRAVATGWYCCTCNFEFVKGRVDENNMVFHDVNGVPHMFCETCRFDRP